MFNENIVKGKWKELKGEIQKIWSKVTDNELEETKGDMTKVSGIVQTHYGETQENVRSKLNDFFAKFPDTDAKKSPNDTFSV